MRGSIRIAVGLMVMMGVAGGIDNATNEQLVYLLLWAIAGASMAMWGLSAMKRL